MSLKESGLIIQNLNLSSHNLGLKSKRCLKLTFCLQKNLHFLTKNVGPNCTYSLYSKVMVLSFTAVEKDSCLVLVKLTRSQWVKQLVLLITTLFTFMLYVICLCVHLSNEESLIGNFVQFIRKAATVFVVVYFLCMSGQTYILHTNPSVTINMTNWVTDTQERVWNLMHAGQTSK